MAYALAGEEGRRSPMGDWILVPRTRHGDDFLVKSYNRGCRQLVLLGAGMDARAYRQFDGVALKDLSVFEVDQQTTFDVKEPLLAGVPLTVKARSVVGVDFAQRGAWAQSIVRHGFDNQVPTVWLLEGLLYYLSEQDVAEVMRTIGALSAPGSAVFHDSITHNYPRMGIAPGGAQFISGSDDYAGLWREYGFTRGFVRDFRSITVDRRGRRLAYDGRFGELTPQACRGQNHVLFVEVEKPRSPEL
jgi:methyltransferase (TIGR00027 family)